MCVLGVVVETFCSKLGIQGNLPLFAGENALIRLISKLLSAPYYVKLALRKRPVLFPSIGEPAGSVAVNFVPPFLKSHLMGFGIVFNPSVSC